jgi:hypothetical protein
MGDIEWGMGNREWSLPMKMVGRIMVAIYKALEGYRPYNTPQGMF